MATTSTQTPLELFGTDDLMFSDYQVVRSRASDHYPVVVTVRIGR